MRAVELARVTVERESKELNALQEDLARHSVLIKPATLEVRHFLNLTSRTVLLFFLVLYVIVEQPAVLILWICSLLIPP